MGDDEDGGELEVGGKVGPLPQVSDAARAVLGPVGGAVQEADVEQAELSRDHEERLDEEVGLEVISCERGFGQERQRELARPARALQEEPTSGEAGRGRGNEATHRASRWRA